MTTDFRALCAELHAAFNTYAVDQSHHELLQRTRAALAQPEPEGPTDEEPSEQEIADIAEDLEWKRLPQKEGSGQSFLLAFARAVLTRWGRPTPQPVPVSERLPGPEDCDEEGRCWWIYPPNFMELRSHATAESAFVAGAYHWLAAHDLPLPGGV